MPSFDGVEQRSASAGCDTITLGMQRRNFERGR
jgi:hypothetical protein